MEDERLGLPENEIKLNVIKYLTAMTQIVVVNGMTAHRANVIARRTGSAAMGVVKAQMITRPPWRLSKKNSQKLRWKWQRSKEIYRTSPQQSMK